MPSTPKPTGIFERAAQERERRLNQSLLEPLTTAFIVGFTNVFGSVSLGVVGTRFGMEDGDNTNIPVTGQPTSAEEPTAPE